MSSSLLSPPTPGRRSDAAMALGPGLGLGLGLGWGAAAPQFEAGGRAMGGRAMGGPGQYDAAALAGPGPGQSSARGPFGGPFGGPPGGPPGGHPPPYAYSAEAAAHRLLARSGGGFDSARLGREARALEAIAHARGGLGGGRSHGRGGTSASPHQAAAYGGGGGGPASHQAAAATPQAKGGAAQEAAGAAPDLATYLSRRHAASVRRILDSARSDAERTAEALVGTRLRDGWRRERAAAATALGVTIPHPRMTQTQTQMQIEDGAATPPRPPRFGASGAPTPAHDRHGRGQARTGGLGLESAAAAAAAPSADGGAALISTAGGGGIVDFAAAAATRAVGAPPLNLESVRGHTALVAGLCGASGRAGPGQGQGQGQGQGGPAAAASLEKGIRAMVAAGRVPTTRAARPTAAQAAVDHGYVTALGLASAVLPFAPAPAYASASVAATSALAPASAARLHAAGALLHLSDQYRAHIVGRVSASAMAGGGAAPLPPAQGAAAQETGPGAFAADVAAHADLELGKGAAASHPWRRAYRSLRCGDCAAALVALGRPATAAALSEGMEEGGAAAATAAAAAVLRPLARVQGNERSIWAAAARANAPKGPASPSQAGASRMEGLLSAVPSASLDAIVDLRLLSTSASTSAIADESTYRDACLALLSLGGGSDPSALASGPTPGGGSTAAAGTIEDYLYDSLWAATFRQSDVNCAAAIAHLGQSVRHWGPAHFEEQDDSAIGTGFGRAVGFGGGGGRTPISGGWAYAVPLLAAQQLATALAYLARVGGAAGLLQATHLAIILSLAGVDLVDLTDRGADGAVAGLIGTAAGQGAPAPIEGAALLTSLLSSFASTLQGTDAKAALEYLILIPDAGSLPQSLASSTIGQAARAYVQRLILDTRAFEALAGVVSKDGTRVQATSAKTTAVAGSWAGALDQHFSSSEVSILLAGAAEEAIRRGNPADACEILTLAGKYAQLLSVLNAELVSLLVAEDPVDEDFAHRRDFWRSAANTFHSIHLNGVRNHVIESLEVEDSLHLGNTFQLIMNLMVFFDRCQDRDWEGAWILIDALGLLPASDNEMSRKVAGYHSLDSDLKGKSFRQVVLRAMESLYQQHSSLKARLGGAQSADAAHAIQQRLGDLRGRARLLVTFVGLCRLEGDVSARIARMEAYLV